MATVERPLRSNTVHTLSREATGANVGFRVPIVQRLGMVYLAIVGGAAALETTEIEAIEQVAWEDLMPECLWTFRVRDFGPLTVAIDTHGNSLYQDVQNRATTKLEELYARFQ